LTIKRIPLLTYAFLFVGFLWSVDSVNAQVIVSTSATAPTENISNSFVVSDTTNSTWQWRYDTENGYRDLGQRFTAASDGVLDAITVQSYYTGGAGAVDSSFTLTVYSFTNTSSSAAIDQTLLTLTGTLPSDIITTKYFVTFDLPDTLDLESGVSYGFLLHFDNGPTSNQYISMAMGTSADYTIPEGSYRIENSGTYPPSSFTTSQTTSLEYYVQVIPEPSASTMALAAAAILAVAVLQRRRRS
jgi:MYXO-CTERM domain-containing protein